jgi:hypothetical protein
MTISTICVFSSASSISRNLTRDDRYIWDIFAYNDYLSSKEVLKVNNIFNDYLHIYIKDGN